MSHSFQSTLPRSYPAHDFRLPKILCVEDDELLGRVLMLLFTGNGYEAEWLNSGSAAWSKYALHPNHAMSCSRTMTCQGSMEPRLWQR